jgi:hypothetical protein
MRRIYVLGKKSVLRSWSVIAFVIFWNLAFWATPRYPQLSILVPLPIIATSSIPVLILLLIPFKTLQKIVIKPDRNIQEILLPLLLLSFIGGVLTLVMLIMLLTGHYSPVEDQHSLCRIKPLADQAWWCSIKTK